MHNIVDGLLPLKVAIDSLVPDSENARLHSSKNLEAVKQSLDRYGQRQAIVVQKGTNIIRAGNARYASAKALGWTEVAAVFVDEDEKTSKAFALADNRTAELGAWDFEQLTASLLAVSDVPSFDEIMDLETYDNLIGWDMSDLEPLMRSTFVPPETEELSIDDAGKVTVKSAITSPRGTSIDTLLAGRILLVRRRMGSRQKDLTDSEIIIEALISYAKEVTP